MLKSTKRLLGFVCSEGKSSTRRLRSSEAWKVRFRNSYLPIHDCVVIAWGNASHLEVVSDLFVFVK